MVEHKYSFPLAANIHYSSSNKYVYVDTPKTGCSKIKRTLNSAEGTALPSPSGAFGYSAELLQVHDRDRMPLIRPESIDEFKKFIKHSRVIFAFVRNPYTRILSAYLDKIAQGVQRRRINLSGPEAERPLSFVEFLRVISSQRPSEMNPHWRPQFIHGGFNWVPYTDLGAFESFTSDFEAILAKSAPELKRRIVSMREHQTRAQSDMKIYYNAECIELVRRIYARDFESFGYSTDLRQATQRPSNLKRLIAAGETSA